MGLTVFRRHAGKSYFVINDPLSRLTYPQIRDGIVGTGQTSYGLITVPLTLSTPF